MAEQANAAGGIDGREVILLVEDDRGDPAAATQAAERLVGQGVAAVIGSYNAATTDPASYVYNRAGVINLMPSCAQPLAMDKGFHQTFRLCFREERTSQATADFVTEVLDAQRIAILHDGSPDATKLAERVQQDVARLGRAGRSVRSRQSGGAGASGACGKAEDGQPGGSLLCRSCWTGRDSDSAGA